MHYTQGVAEAPVLKWKFKTGAPVTGVPLAHQGTLYVASSDNYIYALDTETGEQKWQFRMAAAPPADEKALRPSAPTIKDGILYQGCMAGYLYALDVRSGRPKWTSRFRETKAVLGSPLPVYGAVFVNVMGWGEDAGLMAIHGETGQVLNVYRGEFTQSVRGSFAFVDGALFGISDARCRRLDLRSGSVRIMWLWHPLFNVPIVHEGRLYSVGGAVSSADFRSGAHLYTEDIEQAAAGKHTEVRSEAASCVWNDAIYFGNLQGNLYAFDTMTGKRLWKTHLADRIRCAPAISTDSPESMDAIVYIGSDDGTLWAVDATTGEKLWSFQTGGRVWPDPWVEDGTVYVGGGDGYVYAIASGAAQ